MNRHSPLHPLDPLTVEEITAAVALVRADCNVGETYRFPRVVLHEPEKAEILKYQPGDPIHPVGQCHGQNL
jgi:primary-amine oxidase